MISKEFSSVLKIISNKLEKNKIKWAVIGSTSMVLHEMPVNPKDIDIIMDLEDLYKLPSIFDNNLEVEPQNIPENKPAWRIGLVIDDIEIEFLGEKPDGEYLRELKEENIDYIDLDNIKIPCFKLEIDAKVYARTGRQNKAEMIYDFLKKI